MASSFKWDDARLMAKLVQERRQTMANYADHYIGITRRMLGTKWPPASEPGEPPRMRTGELRDSMAANVMPDGIGRRIGPTGDAAVYGAALELGRAIIVDGTVLMDRSRMAPRPFLRPALQQLAREKEGVQANLIVPLEA